MLSKLALAAVLMVTGTLLANPLHAAAPTSAPASAPATSPAAKTLAITEADNGKTLKLADATAVTITLPGNPTTGYSWAVTKTEGTALEQTGSIQYTPTPVQPGIVGSGGTFLATFHALKPGESTITLGYARPWEKGTPAAKTFTVTLIIEKIPATQPAP